MSIGKNLDLILFRNSFYTFVITKIAGKQQTKKIMLPEILWIEL